MNRCITTSYKYTDVSTERYQEVNRSTDSKVKVKKTYSCSWKSRDSSVVDDGASRVRFPVGAGKFSLHHHVQNGSGAHSAFYPMGTGGSFPSGKAAGAWSWPPSSAEVKNTFLWRSA